MIWKEIQENEKKKIQGNRDPRKWAEIQEER